MRNTSYCEFGHLERTCDQYSGTRLDLFKNRKFTTKLRSHLKEKLESSPILSLDIFDTLILRDNSSELRRFCEVGARMESILEGSGIGGISAFDAFIARHLGTKASYRASPLVSGAREGSLVEIHRTASRLLVGDDRFAIEFINAELENELDRLKPNPFFVNFVKAYKRIGGRVILITDMYMHYQHVAKILAKIGVPPDQFDLLISSADTKVSKSSGGIFPLVEEKLGSAPPESFLHIGDSFKGDFLEPVRRGWRAVHLPLSQVAIQARRDDHFLMEDALKSAHKYLVDMRPPN